MQVCWQCAGMGLGTKGGAIPNLCVMRCWNSMLESLTSSVIRYNAKMRWEGWCAAWRRRARVCGVMSNEGWSRISSVREKMALAKMRWPCRCAMRWRLASVKREFDD